MANTLLLSLRTGMTAATLKQKYERSVSSKYANGQACADLIQSIISGGQVGGPPSIISSVKEAATRASGTFILTSVIATDVVTINGVSFTAVAGAPAANQFQVGANDNATAANLAAAINASVTALVSGYVTAEKTTTTLTPATVTIYSTNYGIQGNQTLIASADSTIVASGARLTGGAADPDAKTYTF